MLHILHQFCQNWSQKCHNKCSYMFLNTILHLKTCGQSQIRNDIYFSIIEFFCLWLRRCFLKFLSKEPFEIWKTYLLTFERTLPRTKSYYASSGGQVVDHVCTRVFHQHFKNSTFMKIFECFSSFWTMQKHAQVRICWMKYTTPNFSFQLIFANDLSNGKNKQCETLL